MAVVPYTFADQSGQIPLSELDANFANVKAFAETAGNVTGNTQANITAVGTLTTLTVTGNVTAPYFLGNVVGNITVAGSNTQVLFNDNGIANASSGMTFNKVSNLLQVTGPINSLGNITGVAVLASGGTIGTPVGVLTLRLGNTNPSTIWIGGNATNVHIGNVNSTTTVAGNLTVGGVVTATGNITGGNLVTAGLITATGNITSAGNITGGNLVTAGLITATGNITSAGNITGGNLVTAGLITATGNITGGNLVTAGAVTSTGNITGGNLSIGGTSTLTGEATAPTAANGTSNTQVATTAFVATNALIQSACPVESL
jgi:hypothetical protein